MSVSKLFARADPTPTAATITAIPSADSYKRQISEAVPQDERLNGPETIPAVPLQQQAEGDAQEANAGAGIGTGAANNTYKSGRSRKPKQRN